MLEKIPVLLVDRSNLTVRLVTNALKNLGVFQVLSCNGPEEAERLVDQHSPRLVITALSLPDPSDGLNLVRSLRVRHPPKALPILMLSSSNDKAMIEKAVTAGVNDFLFKPVYPDVLETRLERLLDRPVSESQRIGEFLIRRGLINADQLDTALRYQRMYSSEHIHISILALYLGYMDEDLLHRLFLEDRVVEEDDFLNRAYQLGMSAKRIDHLRELKERHHLRIGDILVQLRFIRREILENAMRSLG